MSSAKQSLSGIEDLLFAVKNYVPTGLFQLKDTPTGYQGHSGDYLVVNDGETGIHFTGIEKIAQDLTDYGFIGGDGVTGFTGLYDTPTGYLGHSGEYLVVNNGETGIHFTGIEKIAADLTDYGFGGGASSTIPSYTDLPDVTENDGKIVASGCDLYHSCNGTWNKIGGESIPAPDEAPGCVTNLEEYNQYQEYKDSIVNNSMSSAFESALSGSVKERFFNDVCLFKQVNKTSSGNSNVIAGGRENTVYVKSDGTVWAVGGASYDQLGYGAATRQTNPVQVKNVDGSNFTGVVEVSVGQYHVVYLKSDGTVWAAGQNHQGQLGDGTGTNRSNPVQVKNADGSAFSEVVGISTGYNHTVYLKSDGTVWAAGQNSEGQLGDGTIWPKSNPVLVRNIDGSPLTGVVGITTGHSHNAYLKSDGTVWAVGSNYYGQLGDGTTTHRSNPVQVMNVDGSAFSGVVDMSLGHNHSVFLKSDGTVWAVGRNPQGQLGDGTTTDRLNLVQVKNADGSNFTGVISMSSQADATSYLKSDGTLWAVGHNNSGRLGDGSFTDRSNPVLVRNVDGSNFTGVIGTYAGTSHSVFLKSDGTVWAVGINTMGQLGDGTTTHRSNPVQVTNADGSIFTGVRVNSGGATSTPSIEPSVKIIDSGYSWGIFEDDTTINIEATNGSCTFVEWRSSNSSLQNSSSNTTTITINADTSITGVFNC